MYHYLNNARAGIVSQTTLAAVRRHLERELEVGGYKAAVERSVDLANFYELAAMAINAPSASCIAFMDSASRAWNTALYGMPIRPGDKIVTLSSEFGTNLVSLFHFASKVEAKIEVIGCAPDGRFDLSQIEGHLKQGARLVAISHAAAHASIVNPVEEIGRIVRSHQALYLVDGCQAAGQLGIDVERIGCDAYTGTGRKWLRGPRGTGFLFVKPEAPISPLYVDLASANLTFSSDGAPNGVEVRQDAQRFELWERSVATVLGLRNALKEYSELDKNEPFVTMRAAARSIRNCVAQRAEFQLLGEVDSESSIAGFYLRDPSKESELVERFASVELQITAMGDWDCPMHFPRNGAKVIFRLAPHYYTSDETVRLAINTIEGFN